MAAYFEDPRLRQRWNQISQNAETVTENAAAGIWTFQHRYITPCLSSLSGAIDSCTGVCLGDRDERARRQRERARGAHRTLAEYSFDFYDDWYDDYYNGGLGDGGGGSGDGGADSAAGGGGIFRRGFFSTWAGSSSRAEDWDRLLAGSGTGGRSRRHDADGGGGGGDDGGESGGGSGPHPVENQPRPRRSMSYGTRGSGSGGVLRRTTDGDDHRDPTVIPSTAPLGFLGRLPFKIGSTLRYKPSAANLREHPTGGGTKDGHDMSTRDEHEPLLGGGGDGDVEGGAEGEHGEYGEHGKQGWQSTLAAIAAGSGRGGKTGAPTKSMTAAAAAAAAATAATTTAATAAEALMRKRSSTTGSGDTSDSFRSRGDLFASDEEGDEDAVPLDDEFAVALDRVADDRSSGRTRFSSSSSLTGAAAAAATVAAAGVRRKGKRRADTATSGRSALSRSVSYTTIGEGVAAASALSLPLQQQSPAASIRPQVSSASLFSRGLSVADEVTTEQKKGLANAKAGATEEGGGGGEREEADEDEDVIVERLRREEARAAHEEDAEVERKRQAAALLARERGLSGTAAAAAAEAVKTADVVNASEMEPKTAATQDVAAAATSASELKAKLELEAGAQRDVPSGNSRGGRDEQAFVPARLPHFR